MLVLDCLDYVTSTFTFDNFRIVYIFQDEFKVMVIESGDIELDIFAALTNSNVKFLGTMREFVEKIA